LTKLDILLPVYRGNQWLPDLLDSLQRQTCNEFRLIVGDDNANIEESENLVALLGNYSFNVSYFRNAKNLGYANNMIELSRQITSDYVFLAGQDDILCETALEEVSRIFDHYEDVGAITRPYFWFKGSPVNVVRKIEPLGVGLRVFDIRESYALFYKTFESVGQLTGLALRWKSVTEPFHSDVFPCHIYPFASVLKNSKCAYIPEYTVAVRVESSQTRTEEKIYLNSPTESWIRMYNVVFSGPNHAQLRKWGYQHICSNHVGLVQVRVRGGMLPLLQEAFLLIKYRPSNLLRIQFLVVFLLCIFLPKKFLFGLSEFAKPFLVIGRKKKFSKWESIASKSGF
jgi:glycosyltransferase involved in cell wall biosynthesis